MSSSNSMFRKLTVLSFLALIATAQLQPKNPATYPRLPCLRDRARIEDEWRRQRIARVPALLKKYGVDAWLMSQREHAEDTIWWSIKNSTDFDAHRRTVVLFHTNTSSQNPLKWVDNTSEIWIKVREALETIRPGSIALNVDRDIAFSGGLHVGELAVLSEELGEKWIKLTVSKPMLAVEYVASRVNGQLAYYRDMQEMVWAMMEEAFSHRVTETGVTTTEDLEWWFREKMQALNVTTWNHPRVSVLTPESFPGWEGTKDTIEQGDLLHIDWGITAMGLNTDTQHMAYVLRTDEGEEDAPQGLKDGLKKSNRMQDLVLEKMRAGKTGNEVLQQCLELMAQEGIEGQIYSHPIGDWGHDAGAVIGFTNLPTYVPVLGELPILPNTYYSIELYAYHFVPERNETLRFRQEENVYWVEEKKTWEFVRGRQETFHLINKKDNSEAFPRKPVMIEMPGVQTVPWT